MELFYGSQSITTPGHYNWNKQKSLPLTSSETLWCSYMMPPHLRLDSSKTIFQEIWISFDKFRWRKRFFILKGPISCKQSFNGDSWTIDCPDLGIYVFAETRRKVEQEWKRHFAVLWDAIVQQPNRRLANDAMLLKNKLRTYVKEVVGG